MRAVAGWAGCFTGGKPTAPGRGGALLWPALLWLAASGIGGADVNLPELPRGQGVTCVEPTEVMRKNHMDFLFHQRDATMRDGIRTIRHSLVGCVQCHAQRDARGGFISVNAPGQFCRSCHEFTGVKLDCFECHATMPDVIDPAIFNLRAAAGSGDER